LNRFEQGLIFNLLLGVFDKMRNASFGRLGRGRVLDPSEHLLDAKSLVSDLHVADCCRDRHLADEAYSRLFKEQGKLTALSDPEARLP